jgi:hypothetical protein
MNLFQIIVVPFTLLCFVLCAWKCACGPGRYVRIVKGLQALVWVLACLLILNPELANLVAGIFGITRGVDLVLYVFVIIAFVYAIVIYYRFCDIRKEITLIVRHIAIAECQMPNIKGRLESQESSVSNIGHMTPDNSEPVR